MESVQDKEAEQDSKIFFKGVIIVIVSAILFSLMFYIINK